jgi:hypothetical protein
LPHWQYNSQTCFVAVQHTKKDAGDEIEGKKTKRQAPRTRWMETDMEKKREEMDAGETRQGRGRQMEISL